MAKAVSDVWGQARPRVSAEEEALAATRAAAAMAELLAEDAKAGDMVGLAGGSGCGGEARGRKGKGGSGKKK